MQIDTFGAYVRGELEHWGRECALHRDSGHPGSNAQSMLAVLIDYQGDMPGRAQGFKPMETDTRAQRIEDLVNVIAKDNMAMACTLRAYYCGRGRKKVERFEVALQLLERAGERALHVKAYLDLVRRGEDRLHGMLVGLQIAA